MKDEFLRILKSVKREGIDDLIKFNLDPKENIGSKKTSIGRVIRGKEKGNIPTKEQFKRLLELGISFENKGKLQQAKQNRDVAIERNNKAKELEGQVSEELKKRGKNKKEAQYNKQDENEEKNKFIPIQPPILSPLQKDIFVNAFLEGAIDEYTLRTRFKNSKKITI